MFFDQSQHDFRMVLGRGRFCQAESGILLAESRFLLRESKCRVPKTGNLLGIFRFLRDVFEHALTGFDPSLRERRNLLGEFERLLVVFAFPR